MRRLLQIGTFVIDIIDARSNLLWRGWAQSLVEDILDDADRMAKRRWL